MVTGEKGVNFKINNVEHYTSPSGLNADEILNAYGTSLVDMKNAMKKKTFVHCHIDKGFQMDLAEQLETLLKLLFRSGGSYLYMDGYSPAMRETPDVEVGQKGCAKRIFIEIEFRPNEHKDIVKFLIGHKKQTLELGILIVAINREAINRKYSTMPEYEKCRKTIEELQSDCPILVMGIDGNWVPAEG